MAIDYGVLVGCLAAVWLFRNTFMVSFWPELGYLHPFGEYLPALYWLIPWVAVFFASKLYSQRLLFWDETRVIVRALSVATLLAVALTFADKSGDRISRVLIGGMWVLSLPLLPLVRRMVKKAFLHIGIWTKPVLVVGGGQPAEDLVHALRYNAYLGLVPAAVAVPWAPEPDERCADLPVYGPYTNLRSVIDEHSIRDVFIAMPEATRKEVLGVVAACEGHVQSVRIMPDTIGLASVGVETEHIGGNLFLNMRWNMGKPIDLLAKRAFDLVMASLSMVVVAPLVALLAWLVRRDSEGPAFFDQERVGRDGRPFKCRKLRTMYIDADERLKEYLADNEEARKELEEYLKLRTYDPRVTRIGHILRCYSLDELPQLFNVLQGDMSLVGPRPYIRNELVGREDVSQTIVKAYPGITGLWQVSGRNELSLSQRLQLDEYYVRNWSLWQDVIILFRTVSVLLRGTGK